ncbi:hypothetical protein E3N88_40950 [Mikania micrantha]|uniref:Uncharacterized protein n=1 Tax=Mikania micrantha TaxID=192012 RepID=A0A5N6LP17_9ASTR|nr:hypothetical protein E3N88_40950 [Mikania micrantha]
MIRSTKSACLGAESATTSLSTRHFRFHRRQTFSLLPPVTIATLMIVIILTTRRLLGVATLLVEADEQDPDCHLVSCVLDASFDVKSQINQRQWKSFPMSFEIQNENRYISDQKHGVQTTYLSLDSELRMYGWSYRSSGGGLLEKSPGSDGCGGEGEKNVEDVKWCKKG